MWVELFPTSKGNADNPEWDITPRPIKPYEVRLIVWDTKELDCSSDGGMVDAYFRCFFDTKNAQETDTHFRCSTGKASFNYRLLYKVMAPTKNYKLSI